MPTDERPTATPPVGEAEALVDVLREAFSPTFEPSPDTEMRIASLPETTQTVLREFQCAPPYDSEFRTEEMAAAIHELTTQRDAATQRAERAEGGARYLGEEFEVLQKYCHDSAIGEYGHNVAEAMVAHCIELRATIARVRALPTKNIPQWSQKTPSMEPHLVVDHRALLHALDGSVGG